MNNVFSERLLWAFEVNMLDRDRNIWINPPNVYKFIVYQCEIAVVLCINDGSVPTHIQASEYVVNPNLVIDHAIVVVDRANRVWLVNNYSVLGSDIDSWVFYS